MDVSQFYPQSGQAESEVSSAPALQSLQTVYDQDAGSPIEYGIYSAKDETRLCGDENNVHLGDFLSRPAQIFQGDWSNSIVFFQSLNPWSLFLGDLRVVNKINNFNRIRGNLHVKFYITGNSFHYGKLLVSYCPNRANDQLTKTRTLVSADLVEASQRPMLLLDPTTSTGGEMVLPFTFYADALSIPLNEKGEMGDLVIMQLNQLRQANGNNDPVRIIVTAWMTEVELSAPTRFEVQSGTMVKFNTSKKDEYALGPISRPATLVARVAGALVNIPTIAPFARATTMAAGALSNIAQLFGYSKPASLAPYIRAIPRYFGNAAIAIGEDYSDKLTLDPKNEVTIDPRIFGIEAEDQLSITGIVTRESYLNTFNWLANAGTESRICEMYVTPVQYQRFIALPSDELHMTPACFVSQLFQYWRGTMKFRIQVVASAFHRGRLKIVWDPYLSSSTPKFNTQYTYILDIAEERDFTVEVGWGSHRGFLPCATVWNATTDSSAAAALPYNEAANGHLTVYVMNDLTTPSVDVSDVYVNIWTSAGDDMEFMSPSNFGISRLTPMLPQSGVVDMAEGSNSVVQNAPAAQIASAPPDAAKALMVYSGECVTSLRTILKRFTFTTVIPVSAVGSTFWQTTRSAMPAPPGYNVNGPHVTPAAVGYNYCNYSPLSYISSAFMGYRGAVRVKTVYSSTDTTTGNMLMMAYRVAGDTNYQLSATAAPVASDTASVQAKGWSSFISRTLDGMCLTVPSLNPVLEFEVPYYSNRRYMPARRTDQFSTTSNGYNLFYRILALLDFGNTNTNVISIYHAIGEDFQLGFFLGTPVFWVKNDP